MWYQGETDAGTDADATSYAQRFQQAVAAWREAPCRRGVAGAHRAVKPRVQPADPDADRRWSQVREAQRQVARQVPRVGVVPATRLAACRSDPHQSRRQHALGRAVGAGGFGAGLWSGGSLASTGSGSGPAAGGPRRIEFAAVESRMDSIDLEANSFRVEDEAGEVPVAAAVYPQDHRVELVLERPLQGSARVHGGYGKDPATCQRIWSDSCPCWAFGAWRLPDDYGTRKHLIGCPAVGKRQC